MDTRFGELPGTSLVDRMANVYANALMNSQKCNQITTMNQNVSVICNTPALKALSIEMAQSDACRRAILNNLESERYCSACSGIDLRQTAVIEFTFECGVQSMKAAAEDTITWLDNYIDTIGDTLEYTVMRNSITEGLASMNVIQELMTVQNIYITEGNKTAVSQNLVYDIVLHAVASSMPADLSKLDKAAGDKPKVSQTVRNGAPREKKREYLPPDEKDADKGLSGFTWFIIVLCILLVVGVIAGGVYYMRKRARAPMYV